MDEQTEYGDPEVLQRDAEKDLERGLKEMQRALPEYERAERYYTGEECEKYLSRRLKYALTGSENEFYVNLAARVVRAVTDRLEISTLDVTTSRGIESMEVGNTTNSASGSDSPVQLLNETVWRDNELEQEAPDVHLKAGYFGDSYLFMWPNDDGGLDVFFNSPKSTRVFYDPQNPKKKVFAIKWWQTEEKIQRVDLFYDDYVVKYRTRVARPGTRWKNDRPSLSISSRSFQRLTPADDPDVDEYGVMENPLGRIPLWHFRTARPYGIPLHRNAYGPQDAITKLIRQQMTITDFAAFPQRWALGETGEGSDVDFDWGDDETDRPDELASEFTSGPGRIWVLKNFRNVGQFQEANVDQVLKPLDKFVEMMAAVTGTPLTYLNKIRGTASTPLSGAAQRELEASHLKTVQYVQNSFGATWRDLFESALEYLEVEDSKVTVEWAPAWFRDDKETWDAVLSQQAAGVPKRYTLLEFFPEDLVTSWGYTEEEPNGPQELAEGDEFQQEQRKPVRPELRANNDGDTSRFNKEKDTVSSQEAASKSKEERNSK